MELKPCPFCGAKVEIKYFDYPSMAEWPNSMGIRCPNSDCPAHGPLRKDFQSRFIKGKWIDVKGKNKKAENGLIKAWNIRSQ